MLLIDNRWIVSYNQPPSLLHFQGPHQCQVRELGEEHQSMLANDTGHNIALKKSK